MQLSFDQIRAYFESRLAPQRIGSRDKVSVRCPFHDDRTPSMTIFLTGNGGAFCNGCGAKGNVFQFEARLMNCSLAEAEIAVAQLTGAKPETRSDGGTVTAVYDYRNLSGEVEFQKRRIKLPDGKKTFRVFRPKDRGWESGIGDAKRVLYHLPELVTANVVLVAEGERDCETLDALDLGRELAELRVTATTNFDGAWQPGQSAKWLAEYTPFFAGKRVVVFVDNDDAGRAWATHIARAVIAVAHSVKLLALPGLEEKGDVSDWMLTHSRDELQVEIKNAPAFSDEALPAKREIFVSAGRFMSEANDSIDWIVDGVIQRGANGFFAAQPKGGKSWVSADLLLSMACGANWLGFRTEPTRVALVSREDNPALTAWRMKSLLSGKGLTPTQFSMIDENLYVNSRQQTPSLMLDNPAELDELIAEIKSRSIEFCVLDVFNVLHGADENDNTEMRRVLDNVRDIQKLTGCAIGIVHHFNKHYQGGSLALALRGAGAMAGFAEWMVGITMDDHEHKIRKMELELKAASSPESFSFHIDTPEGVAVTRIVRVDTETSQVYRAKPHLAVLK